MCKLSCVYSVAMQKVAFTGSLVASKSLLHLHLPGGCQFRVTKTRLKLEERRVLETIDRVAPCCWHLQQFPISAQHRAEGNEKMLEYESYRELANDLSSVTEVDIHLQLTGGV